jgi:hypothetical protein
MSKAKALHEYMNQVARSGCVMARLGYQDECLGAVELHHPRDGVGAAQRESDWLVIPICRGHHTGALGVHNRRSFYVRTKLNEWDLLAAVIEFNWRQDNVRER